MDGMEKKLEEIRNLIASLTSSLSNVTTKAQELIRAQNSNFLFTSAENIELFDRCHSQVHSQLQLFEQGILSLRRYLQTVPELQTDTPVEVDPVQVIPVVMMPEKMKVVSRSQESQPNKRPRESDPRPAPQPPKLRRRREENEETSMHQDDVVGEQKTIKATRKETVIQNNIVQSNNRVNNNSGLNIRGLNVDVKNNRGVNNNMKKVPAPPSGNPQLIQRNSLANLPSRNQNEKLIRKRIIEPSRVRNSNNNMQSRNKRMETDEKVDFKDDDGQSFDIPAEESKLSKPVYKYTENNADDLIEFHFKPERGDAFQVKIPIPRIFRTLLLEEVQQLCEKVCRHTFQNRLIKGPGKPLWHGLKTQNDDLWQEIQRLDWTRGMSDFFFNICLTRWFAILFFDKMHNNFPSNSAAGEQPEELLMEAIGQCFDLHPNELVRRVLFFGHSLHCYQNTWILISEKLPIDFFKHGAIHHYDQKTIIPFIYEDLQKCMCRTNDNGDTRVSNPTGTRLFRDRFEYERKKPHQIKWLK